MHRLLRDTIVAVAGGVVVSLIITFTTSLGQGLLVLVWIGVLAACGLILAAPQVPRLVRQRRESFRAEAMAEARSAMLAELTPSSHDVRIYKCIISIMPPDGNAVSLLKEETVWNGFRISTLTKIDDAIRQMEFNVIGMDQVQANAAYRDLLDALNEFRTFVSLKTFPVGNERVGLSDQWDYKDRNEAGDRINELGSAAGIQYDRFLTVCHRHGIDS